MALYANSQHVVGQLLESLHIRILQIINTEEAAAPSLRIRKQLGCGCISAECVCVLD